MSITQYDHTESNGLMSRLNFLSSQIEQCKKLAQAMPPGTVRRELERLAYERQNELDQIKSDKLRPKD